MAVMKDIDVSLIYNPSMRRALSIIDSLKRGWFNPPEIYYQKRINFEVQSYSHSAIREIELYFLDFIEKSPTVIIRNKSPIDLMEEFRQLMDEFSCKGSNENARFMFSVYYDVATEVLDVLISNIKERLEDDKISNT